MAITDVKEIAGYMRARGKTYQEIGNLLGVSRQRAWYMAQKCGGENQVSAKRKVPARSAKATEKIIYPGIRYWVQKNHSSLQELAKLTGCAYTTLYRVLLMGTPPRMSNITRILVATGLAYEDAFWKEDEKNG